MRPSAGAPGDLGDRRHRRSPGGRRRSAAVASAVAILALTVLGVACGGDPSETGTVEGGAALLTDAGRRTLDERRGVVEVEIALTAAGRTGAAGGIDLSMRGEGAFDRGTGRAWMEVRFDSTLGDLLGSRAAEAVPGLDTGAEASVELVVDGSSTYLRSVLLALLEDPSVGGLWVAFDHERLEAEHGAGAPNAAELLIATGWAPPLGDPSTLLDWLAGVTGEVEFLGEDRLAGRSVRQYRARADLGAALEATPAAERDRFVRASRLFGYDPSVPGGATVGLEVFVDDAGLVRRIVVEPAVDTPGDTQDGAPGGANGWMAFLGIEARVVVDFLDLGAGAEVSVDVPDASETVDALELIASLRTRAEQKFTEVGEAIEADSP